MMKKINNAKLTHHCKDKSRPKTSNHFTQNIKFFKKR